MKKNNKKQKQNETKHNTMSEMQITGKKQRSTIDNTVIAGVIIEQRRIEKNNTCVFFADPLKCFDKLWLQDSTLLIRIFF